MTEVTSATVRPVVDPEARAAARSLSLRYLLAATGAFLLAGALGMVLRDSQADLGRLGDNAFYAVMTAHGLGAFVGWAAFSVMGLSWWVLAEVGFPLGPWARRFAHTAFWCMVTGVGGVVVTTLCFSFGASWVFLYPLPFHSAGQWSEAVTAAFAASVLVVGVAILAWCAGILCAVTGPALHAVRGGLLNRLGLAIGLGYLFPRRFATNPMPVPYPVIPLAVIAIDMVIATLPLAVLLVEMIVQAAVPSVSVDPLLAKNVLWWFGHPVVYLLLFPAVAVFYLLVPRLAGRPLVAGNLIAVAWTIAVVANVVVWAHHIYLDYPVGSVQAGINTTMQPITFALTIPSALSLYSLLMTIFRSDWKWNAAGTALFLALTSWLIAGLSGVVNATIAFDAFVHNTLWVVGHFHHMALLNIGLLIFAALYAWLPEWLGRPWYSERLAQWHIWLTFFAGTATSVVWLIQGLDGAPRRFSVLPERYDDLTGAAVPLVWILALAQLLFVFNLTMTLLGRRSRATQAAIWGPARRVAGLSMGAQAALVGATVVVVGGLAVAGWGIARSHTAAAAPSAGAAAAGREVFLSAGCGGCHSLAAAAGTGTVGPNLDRARPSRSLVVTRVTNGMGAMPSFKDQLTPEQIRAVARYVSSAAAGPAGP